jgi:hypothetical protein
MSEVHRVIIARIRFFEILSTAGVVTGNVSNSLNSVSTSLTKLARRSDCLLRHCLRSIRVPLSTRLDIHEIPYYSCSITAFITTDCTLIRT